MVQAAQQEAEGLRDEQNRSQQELKRFKDMAGQVQRKVLSRTETWQGSCDNHIKATYDKIDGIIVQSFCSRPEVLQIRGTASIAGDSRAPVTSLKKLLDCKQCWCC